MFLFEITPQNTRKSEDVSDKKNFVFKFIMQI